MIRGVGDPLVAMYARAYLSRKGVELMRGRNQYLMNGFKDYLFTEKVPFRPLMSFLST
jgi:hypothetical protein